MNEERKKIFEKVRKCLALSKSSNEHEAAAALRQARALMEKNDIDQADMLAYEACEERIKAGATKKPAIWEAVLARKVSDAFGCRIIFASAGWTQSLVYQHRGAWHFIGVGAAPEIAGHAFSVLLRQCKRARTAYIKTHLRCCKTSTKTRRADLFCEGWVHAVAGKLDKFAGNERQEAAIDAFASKMYPALRDIKPRNRSDGRRIGDRECNDVAAGVRSGRNAELNRGVNGASAPLALE